MKPKILLFLFIIVAITELCGEFNHNINLIYITKPLLMVTLSLYYFFSTKNNFNQFSTFILLGLLFSIGGDSFLMFQGSSYFIAGLSCFLITHLFYIAAFLNYKKATSGFLHQKPWFVLPFLVYLIALLSYLWNDLGDMAIPVIVYSTIICIMASVALNLMTKISKPIFIILFTGITLFLFSDSVIALDKFKSASLILPKPNLLIMTTYILAQLLIVKSAIKLNR